jgi:hypothetical protein
LADRKGGGDAFLDTRLFGRDDGVGAVTPLAVRMVVWPGMDMVIAMIIGMTLGMLMVDAMMPASLIGMYGGFSGCATPWRLALARCTPQL